MLRRTAASVVASVALLSPTAVNAAPSPEQAVQAVADSAAETYRLARAEILQRYRTQTEQAQRRLSQASNLDAAWAEYKRSTREAAAQAKASLASAREEFRRTVAVARGMG